jgi:pimeloyl-ACP methyl ester carboxylesterase
MSAWQRVDRIRGVAPSRATKSTNAVSILGLGSILGVAVIGALANNWLAVRAERKRPPQGQFMTIGGVRLHYIERGEGPVIVLLHGNGVMAQDFVQSGIFDDLARDHRVIAFDRPGFGFSDRPRTRIWTPDAQAELLHKALQRLDVKRAVIVGHSWGTLVALALALRAQAATTGLVLLSGYYFPSVRSDVALGSWPSVPVIGDIMRYTISPLLGRLMARSVYRKMFAPTPVPPQFVREFPLELAVRPSQIRATAGETALMIPGAAGLVDHYRELALPIAIMGGSGDKIVNTENQSGRLNGELPQSTLRCVPGAGHMIHHIAPEEVVAVIQGIAKSAPI